jgi:GNAT superfamily N-acetyltransferase
MERILYNTRKVSRSLLPKAFPLLEAQYREHGLPMGGARLRRAMRELILAENGAMILTSDASGVAALSWQYSIERGGRVAWLEELYVTPDQRGRGIGKALLDAAAREAKKAKCVALELEVMHGHERAARLYLREGFEELPRRRYTRPLRHGRRPSSVAS